MWSIRQNGLAELENALEHLTCAARKLDCAAWGLIVVDELIIYSANLLPMLLLVGIFFGQ